MASPERSILFHLGFQKTGTTSIQAMLDLNRHRFPEVDIRAYGLATRDIRRAGRSWCAAPTSGNEARLRAALSEAVERFVAGGRRHCLVSDENVLGRVAWDPTGDVLGWARRILPMIEQATGGLTARFVFYTRAPEAWLRSVYNQSVKRARVTAPYEDWCRTAPFRVDWECWRAELQAVTGVPVELVSMEDELARHGCLGPALLERVGAGPEALAHLAMPEPRNPSLSARALRLMRGINRLPLPDRVVIRLGETLERIDARMRPLRGLGGQAAARGAGARADLGARTVAAGETPEASRRYAG